MRLLASTDFALRVLIRLATTPAGPPVSVGTLAGELGGLSRNHLHKVVQDLATLGLVRTVRGKGGGVLLAMPPEQISIGAVIRQLEAEQPMVECFRSDGGACALLPRCRLKAMLGTAWQSFVRSLDAHTLADCIQEKPSRAPAGPARAS